MDSPRYSDKQFIVPNVHSQRQVVARLVAARRHCFLLDGVVGPRILQLLPCESLLQFYALANDSQTGQHHKDGALCRHNLGNLGESGGADKDTNYTIFTMITHCGNTHTHNTIYGKDTSRVSSLYSATASIAGCRTSGDLRPSANRDI